ncbi:MAG TPA: PHP-associated domain-containing protein [Candidatus Dormibacteraeota bacterium]|nr:PHP-associated domain-containing protein [Candidatus Dormibacteraeota bacterium]
MDLVTLSDHDSIDGAECLRPHKNLFLSEEVTCQMPSGTELHVGVYDISERQHYEIQSRRKDLLSLLAYLSERRLFYTVNHVFSSLTGRRNADDFLWFESLFPAYETRNGQMLPEQNALAVRLAQMHGKAVIGGSDAHTLASVGTTYTEVHGARSVEQFLSGIRVGRGVARGEEGRYSKLTRDVLQISVQTMRERRWTIALAPLIGVIPAWTFLHICTEMVFSRYWEKRLFGKPSLEQSRLWDLGNQIEEAAT